MPQPSLVHLQQRARAVRAVRRFFEARDVLELDTPILREHGAMEPHLVCFEVAHYSPDGKQRPLYLQTSPEYAMKIALAQYRVPIYQLTRSFRNEEQSSTHHWEFTLVEWYRPGFDHHALMHETEELVRAIATALFPSADSGENQAKRPIDNNLGEQAKRPIDNNLGEQAKRPIDKKLSCPSGLELSRPFERLSVRNAFLRYAEIDLWRCPSDEALAKLALERGCRVSLDWSWEDCFHAILLQCVEPHLGQAVPTFLFDYPERLGALARCAERDYGRVAERFELYAGGLELCNGFHELNDPLEQRQRFLAEAALRAQLGRPAMPLDEGLLSALSELPDCAGNALGFERVLMLLLGAEHIQELLLLC